MSVPRLLNRVPRGRAFAETLGRGLLASLPPLGRAQRITLRDGSRLEGWSILRADGLDVLSEVGERTFASGDVMRIEAAPPESLFAKTRASFRRDLFLEHGEDRYSGLPGSRNLLWFDQLAGERPVAILRAKEASYRLSYELLPWGFASLVHPRGKRPPASQLADALQVAEQTELALYFERYDATSFEALTPTPDPVCLRAIGLMRYYEPTFRDSARARQDLERALLQMPGAAQDAAAQQVLRSLAGGYP